MEIDLVNAPAAAVEDLQLRRVAVGVVSLAEALGTADRHTVAIERGQRPGGVGRSHGFSQRDIGAEQVVVRQLVELVEDFVRLPGHAGPRW
jgi:hypothetical protein